MLLIIIALAAMIWLFGEAIFGLSFAGAAIITGGAALIYGILRAVGAKVSFTDDVFPIVSAIAAIGVGGYVWIKTDWIIGIVVGVIILGASSSLTDTINKIKRENRR